MTDPAQDPAASAPGAATPPGAPGAAPAPPSRRGWLLAAGGLAASAGAGLSWWRQGAGGASAQSNANGLANGSAHGSAPGSAPGSAAGPAPDSLWALQAQRVDGSALPLANLRGKPLLINFWATWCAPCVREMPEIDRFHREFSPQGWQVLGLAIDQPQPVSAFLARVKVGFPIALAGLDGMDLLHGLGNPQGGLPFSVAINAAGLLVQRKLGETNFEELAGWARKA